MSPTRTQDDQRFLELVQAAPFIFTGEVVKPGESTLAIIPPGDGIAVIKVGTVFRSPAVLRALHGQRVTVQFAKGRLLKKGTQALFYATGWIFGEGIAVVELAREAVPRDPKGMLSRVVRAQLRLEDDRLLARLSAADMVVTGLVASAGEIEEPVEDGIRSEHDPEWRRAEILVDRFEKGAIRSVRATAYYPSSVDEAWINSPKIEAGQRGTWILHRAVEGKRGRRKPPGPAVFDALDFQARANVERVRALLKLILV